MFSGESRFTFGSPLFVCDNKKVIWVSILFRDRNFPLWQLGLSSNARQLLTKQTACATRTSARDEPLLEKRKER